jgi:hypothetical protein
LPPSRIFAHESENGFEQKFCCNGVESIFVLNMRQTSGTPETLFVMLKKFLGAPNA